MLCFGAVQVLLSAYSLARIMYRKNNTLGHQTGYKFLHTAFCPAVTEISLEGEPVCTVFQILGLQIRNLAGNT